MFLSFSVKYVFFKLAKTCAISNIPMSLSGNVCNIDGSMLSCNNIPRTIILIFIFYFDFLVYDLNRISICVWTIFA